MIRTWIFLAAIFTTIVGCQQSSGTPKPRAYPRIEYPNRGYNDYSEVGCPYSFQYPSYAEINKKERPCWFDIYMPVFKARIHCSYIPVTNEKGYDDLVKDAFVIAGKINERANYMEETPIRNTQGVGGLALHWTGPAASPVHFFLTDTTQHFFTAALYFDSKVQPDSLAPIVAFIQKDIDQMINTFSWKK
jgi:gliding motility-associated lipoprotein GldD